MCTGLLAVLLGLVALRRCLAPNNSAGTRLSVPETRPLAPFSIPPRAVACVDAGLRNSNKRARHEAQSARNCVGADPQARIRLAPSGPWSDDDFDVLADGAVVGRIFKANAAP